MQIIIKRTTTHRHLYLPKDYSGSPPTSIYTEWTDEEAEAYLTMAGVKVLSLSLILSIATGLSLKFRESNTVKGSGSYKYL